MTGWDVSDAELVQASVDGHADAWAELVERYAQPVWDVARRHGLDDGDSAEVSRATWLHLVQHLGEILVIESVETWLIEKARCESVRVLRLTRRPVPGATEIASTRRKLA
jgi:DNA-directed RNA polymerase specialized sigma24 family protein